MTSFSHSSSRVRRRRRSSGVVIPHEPRWFQRLAALLIFISIRILAATLRLRWNDQSARFEGSAPGAVIYCFWHNRLVLSTIAYWNYVSKRNPTPGVAALVSASRDGGFLAAILQCFNVQAVRGSSSRRGPQALLELTTCAERGYDLAITPDGPRGPRYIVQEGAVSLAQVTGLAIIPFSYHLNWKISLKSWDRLQIPLPFARCQMNVGKPIFVPREATDTEREALRQEIERRLIELSQD